jgi:hypothetical protein
MENFEHLTADLFADFRHLVTVFFQLYVDDRIFFILLNGQEDQFIGIAGFLDGLGRVLYR